MLQILGIRALRDNPEKKYDAFHDRGWGAESIQDLFANLDAILKGIPQNEHWNLYFTPAYCTDKKREFQSLSVLFFDIDHIDTSRLAEYTQVVCNALRVNPLETGVVASGNGIHFYIGLQVPIVSKDFFKQNRDHYKALTSMIDRALKAAGLPGDPDPSVFDPRRLMRLPGTVNKKPGKADRSATLLNATVIPVNFDITALSGIPTVKKEDQIDESHFKKFPKVDNQAIFQGCGFLRFCRDNPHQITEPLWYAALSITSRMDEGGKVSHELSRGHRGYSPSETDLKIEQAQNASGPRTCESISHHYDGCKSCPNFKKITSPILLRSPDAIKTEHTGFHDMVYDAETGKVKRGKPNYSDLRRFFEKENVYRSHDRLTWIWRKTHFEEISNEELQNFAQTHFEPYAVTALCDEFMKLVQRTNLVKQATWNAATRAKINFQNGVLDISTQELSPHSPDYGFKYCLPYDYDPKARAPLFEKFLEQVTSGRQELIQTLLEFCGYALSGDSCWTNKALVLDGDGSNGKSTFIDMLKAVAGSSYSVLSFKELSTADRRTPLDGALFNITEETPNKIMDTIAFKNLITGGELQVRKLYKNPYMLRNRSKLIFSCNEMPTTPDTTRGFFRRFLIIPFSVEFSEEKGNKDAFILDKLLTELPGVFNLFLAGYLRLKKEKRFSKGEKGDAELAEYQESVDPVLAWFKSNVVIDEDATGKESSLPEMFTNFDAWAQNNGYRYHEKNSIGLGIRLSKLVPNYKQRCKVVNRDGKTTRVLENVSYREERIAG